MTKFAQRLRQRREELNLTQKQVAEGCGVDRTTIFFYEKGTREPYLDVAIGLTKVLKVTLAWLAGQDTNRGKPLNVPVYKLPKPGEPLEIQENVIGEEVVEETEDIMFCYIAKDNSMAGVNIFKGDMVCIQKLEKPSLADVVLVEVPEHGVILRRVIYLDEDRIIFHAEAPTEPDLIFNRDQNPQYRIIGKWVFKKTILR